MNLIKNNIISLILIFAGLLGMYASLILSIDKLRIAEDPTYVIDCKISDVVDCTKVMNTPEASVLGFPNTFFGLICYSACFTFGLCLLLNRGNITSIIWKLGLPFATIAFLFSYWLLYRAESVYSAICPYCLLSAIASTLIFSAFTYKVVAERSQHKNLAKYWALGTLAWLLFVAALLFISFS